MKLRSCSVMWMMAGCADQQAELGQWTEVWSEHFDGTEGSPPDPSVWVHDIGGDGWGNNQLEYNTGRSENIRLNGDGQLIIEAFREDYEGNAYTSGRLKTAGLKSFEHGRLEINAKMPSGQGVWPALWLLGDRFEEVGWPNCGEIDIMEMRGDEPNTIIGTVHGPGYSGGDGVGGSTTQTESLADGFHSYVLEWDPGHIVWRLDGERFHTLTRGDLPEGAAWVFDQSFFLLMNVAVGGNFLENPTDATTFPVQMVVDSVQYWTRE